MNIIYYHQYFKPAEGVRSFEFIKYLCGQGHNVSVITAETVDKDFKMDGLTILSTSTKYNNNMSKWQRIMSFAKFMVAGFFKGMSCKKTDLIYATSTPLTIGFPAVLVKKLKRTKLIFEVRDVWPDIPIEMGFISNGLVIKILKWFEKWIYKNSVHIVPLSKGMYDNIRAKGVPENKLTTIENIANLYLYSPISEILETRNKEGFLCIHPGTMGMVNGLDFVLDTAKCVAEKDSEIKFLLIGEGNQKECLKQRVADEKITNIEIKDGVSKREIARITQEANLGFMCVDTQYKILEDNSANKFFDFLAAGLPIAINYGGWQKEVIEEKKCGFSETSPQAMAKKILELKKDYNLQREMAVNSKKTAELYSTQTATGKLNEIIKSI